MPSDLHRMAIRPRLIEKVAFDPPAINSSTTRSVDVNVPGVDGSMILVGQMDPAVTNGLVVINVSFIGGSGVRVTLLNTSTGTINAGQTEITIVGF